MPVETHVSTSCRRAILYSVLSAALAGCGGGGGGGGGAGTAAEPLAPAAALPRSAGVSFSARSIELSEAARHVSIGITRTGEGAGATTIGYRLQGVSATLPADLEPAEGQLHWADGETGERTVELLIHSDDELESSETVELLLEPVEGDLPDAQPLTITVLDAPCDGSLPSRIERDTTLAAPCYRLDANLELAASARLQLDAGTTIIASAGTRINVSDNATLVTAGNARRPVRLVGGNHQPGYWQGVRIASTSALQQLVSTTIADAVIGVEIAPGSSIVSIDGGAVDNTSVAALRLPLDQAEALDAATRFSRSDGGVELTSSSMRRDDHARLPGIGTHYALQNDLLVAGSLSLDPGVDLRLARNRRAFVAGSGSIQAIGTADRPIRIGAIETVAGAWLGLQLSGSDAPNRMEHVTILHGGGDATRDGNLSISGNATQLVASHVAFEDSAGVGLWLDGSLPLVSFDAARFANNRLGEVRRGARIEDSDTL